MAEQIYDIVEKAIRSHSSSVTVPKGTTEQDVYMAVREVMRDNPDIFWFSHQWTFDEEKSRILLRYTLSIDRTFKSYKSIDDVVTYDFFQGQKEAMMAWSEAARVAYVYRWIAGYCRYNVYSAYNQTIYSVFVYRNSVCTGIAKATQYLLKQLNIESRLVFGRLHNSNDTSRHCWLIVKTDGKWYHHDPTFALPSLSDLLRHSGEDEIISDGKVVYNGFLTSTEAMQRTRTIEDADTLPLCTGYVSDNDPLDIGVVDIHRKRSYKGCLIASGSTADIYQHKAGYVIKEFHQDVRDKLIEHEQEIMSRLRGCKHLLQMDGNESNGIIIEQATPLTNILQCHYYQLTAQGLCSLLKDVVRGIMECRERGVIYRDIHPANIYLAEDGSYKLGDFGSCYIKGQSPCDEGGLASKWFIAPETIQGIFDERSQVYMVAMVAYYLLNNSRPPFWGEYRESAFDVRMSGRAIPMPAKLMELSESQSDSAPSLDISDDDFLDDLEPAPTFVDAFRCFLAETLSFDSIHRQNSLSELLCTIEYLQNLTIDHVEGDECDSFDEDDCGSSGDSYLVPGDNPLLINNGSDCDVQDNSTNVKTAKARGPMSTPDFCSTCECNRGIVVSNGEECMADVECIPDSVIDIPMDVDNDGCEEIDSDLYGMGEAMQDEFVGFGACPDSDNCAPFCRTMGDQFCSTAWPGIFSDIDPAFSIVESSDSTPPLSLPEGHTYELQVPSAPVCGANTISALGGILGSIGGLFSCIAFPSKRRTRSDDVYSSVYGPAEVKRDTNMLVQVFLHTASSEKMVQIIASQVDKNAERRGYTPLSCKMKKGDKADVEINIYDKKLIKNEKKSIVWNGVYTQCTFRHFIDDSIAADNLYCEVNIYVNGVPVGCTSFLTEIVSHEARNLYAMPDAKKFEKIFVSYSHQDYDRVKYLVQGFRAQGIDYFFDNHNLRSGDIYSERIFEYIDKADLFMLCWSANARESEYVEKELKRALSHVYPQVARDSETLKIRPISIEPRAEFPPSIRDIYHIEEL